MFIYIYRLVDNPICMESGVTDKFCSLPSNTTTAYSTLPNNCIPTPCGSGQVSSPNCKCAFPYTGSFIFKAPSFSSLGNTTIYESLRLSLMTFFQKTQMPVDAVSLMNPYRNLDDYLVLNLEVFPSGELSFNRTGILWLGFVLSNQTFKPSKDFNTYVFIAQDYDNFLSGKCKNTNIHSFICILQYYTFISFHYNAVLTILLFITTLYFDKYTQ